MPEDIDTVKQCFEQIPIHIGTIRKVKQHPKTGDYIVLIHIGNITADKQVIIDLKKSYSMEDLAGKQVIYIETAHPQVVEGVESLGFILATRKEGKPILVTPEIDVSPGALVVGLSNVEVYRESNNI